MAGIEAHAERVETAPCRCEWWQHCRSYVKPPLLACRTAGMFSRHRTVPYQKGRPLPLNGKSLRTRVMDALQPTT